MAAKIEMSRVPGSRDIRIELSERTAELLLRGVGLLDPEQQESLRLASPDVQDVHAQFVIGLQDELGHARR